MEIRGELAPRAAYSQQGLIYSSPKKSGLLSQNGKLSLLEPGISHSSSLLSWIWSYFQNF
jgi:hypothetical protein